MRYGHVGSIVWSGAIARMGIMCAVEEGMLCVCAGMEEYVMQLYTVRGGCECCV